MDCQLFGKGKWENYRMFVKIFGKKIEFQYIKYIKYYGKLFDVAKF